jgi:glutaredoxin
MFNLDRKWTIIGSKGCPYCRDAIEISENKKLEYKFYELSELSNYNKNFIKIKTNNYKYIPIIFNKDNFIGGLYEFKKLLNKYETYTNKYRYNFLDMNDSDRELEDSEIIKINIDTGQKKYYNKYSQILVKKYLPIYIKELVYDLPDEYYIVCPSYKNNYLQIGITGTAKEGEDLIESLSREVQEEVGMRIKKNTDNKYFLKVDKNGRLWNYTSVFQDNFEPNTIILKNTNKDIQNKIAVVLYGDKQILLKNIEKCIEFKNLGMAKDDNISDICIVNVKLAKRICKEIHDIENSNKIKNGKIITI